LDATSLVAGTFVYTPPAGTLLSVGTHTLSVTFTPTDTIDYLTATKTVNIGVDLIFVTVKVTCPAGVTYDGKPHSCSAVAKDSKQNDVSSLGTFTWSPASSETSAGSYLMVATFSGSAFVTSSSSATLAIAKPTESISCSTTPVQFAYPTAPVINPCSVVSGGVPVPGAYVTYTSVSGASIVSGTTLKVTAPSLPTSVIKITGATIHDINSANYTQQSINSATPISIPVLQIAVNLNCTYTPIYSYGASSLAPVQQWPAQATYGDSGTLTCNSNSPQAPAYSLVKNTTASLKSTLVVSHNVATVTFRGLDNLSISVKVATKDGYAAVAWPPAGSNAATIVSPRPLYVALNSPTWTFDKGAGSSPLKFTVDTVNGPPLAFHDVLPTISSSRYIVTNGSGNVVTLATSSPIGQYAATPNFTLYGYAPHWEPGTVTIVPDPTQLTRSITSVSISTTVSTPKSATVTVTNKTGETLTITASGLANTPFSATPAAGCAALATGGSCNITVLFTPTGAGSVPATGTPAITMSINATDANSDIFATAGTPHYVVFPALPVTVKGSAD
jgi:hypothetical protein